MYRESHQSRLTLGVINHLLLLLKFYARRESLDTCHVTVKIGNDAHEIHHTEELNTGFLRTNTGL